MALLLDVASFLLLLLFASCEDAHLEEKVSPVFNMRLDPGTKTLTWDSRGNVTQQECTLDTPPGSSTRQHAQVKGDRTYVCRFPNAVLHRGATLTVEGTAEGSPFRSVLEFRNAGEAPPPWDPDVLRVTDMDLKVKWGSVCKGLEVLAVWPISREGSGAVNFSCLIYHQSLMGCSWTPGPTAPPDVQYQLFGWTSSREDVVECPRYTADASGTRVGCRFDELVGPQPSDAYFFLVNGTSAETPIQFTDFAPVSGIRIEKFDPPANLSVRHNGSHHVIRWDNPRLRFEVSSNVLYYELDIQRKGSSSKQDSVFLRGRVDNAYLMPAASVTAGHSVRARVKLVRSELWSDWTATVRFGLPNQDAGGLPVALLGMVVGVAALVITILMFLCARFSLTHKLFPSVPQVNTEVVGVDVAFLEDVVECPRYTADASGTRVGCRFDELVGPQPSDAYFFLVNGTSAETPIQFTDFAPVSGIRIEKFDPPANLSVRHNGSHHVIRWDNPRLRFEVSSNVLYYELDIQREGSSSKQDSVFLRGREDNAYLMPAASVSAGHSVRARVKLVRSELWSDWTATVRFGLPDQDAGGLPVALLGMVVGVAALVITILMFLCARFSLTHKLFPPVPQVNTEVAGVDVAFLEVAWDGDSRLPSLQEAEDILSVDEVQPVASGHGDPMGPASPRTLSPESFGPERPPLDV